MKLVFLISLASIISVGMLTGIIKYYCDSWGMIDIPNERSSHSLPTPTGGGVSVVLLFTLISLALDYSKIIQFDNLTILLLPSIMVAMIGFIDDLNHVPAFWRLLVHFLSAILFLNSLGGFPPLDIGGLTIDLGWFGYVFGSLYLVWLLNLYNFMDGIDGISSIGAITVCVSIIFIMIQQNIPLKHWVVPLLLASTVGGFLFWNFPVAKIFMGDGCSGFLGFTIGLFSIQAAQVMPQMFWVCIVLLAVFIVDATYTLMRRIITGQKFYKAHNEHAFQIASRRHSHVKVSLIVGLINIVWLLPIAYMISTKNINALVGVIIAYLPLIGLEIFIKNEKK